MRGQIRGSRAPTVRRDARDARLLEARTLRVKLFLRQQASRQGERRTPRGGRRRAGKRGGDGLALGVRVAVLQRGRDPANLMESAELTPGANYARLALDEGSGQRGVPGPNPNQRK